METICIKGKILFSGKKIWISSISHLLILLRVKKVKFFFMQLFLKILSGMADNVDPDLEHSEQGLHCAYTILSET